MSTDEERLLDSSLLPGTLWNTQARLLLLPPVLACTYAKLIDQYGLRALSERRDPDNPPVGGLTKERTDQHFAQAFDGSVARTQLAVLDPERRLLRASNAFIQTLGGNEVCITDAPCGAGAAAFAFLATIAELRSENVLPRIPLDVHLLGAEISEHARRYAIAILDEMQPFLQSQAVFVLGKYVHWDVLDSLANTDLITRMTRASSSVSKRLLIVANFSGFLERDGRRTDAEPQLEELFRHASGDGAVVVWIEPHMNRATASGGLFQAIREWARKKWHRFSRVNTQGEVADPVLTSESRFQSPLNPSQTHAVRLAVMRLDLERST